MGPQWTMESWYSIPTFLQYALRVPSNNKKFDNVNRKFGNSIQYYHHRCEFEFYFCSTKEDNGRCIPSPSLYGVQIFAQ